MSNEYEALREIDELHGCQVAPLLPDDQAGDLRSRWHLAVPGGLKGPLAAVVRDGLALGLELRQVARVVEVPVHHVCEALMPSVDPEKLLRIEGLLRSSPELRIVDIARHVDVDPCAVAQLQEALGQKVRHRRQWLDEGLKRRIVELHQSGSTPAQIARGLQLSRDTVKTVLRRQKKAS